MLKLKDDRGSTIARRDVNLLGLQPAGAFSRLVNLREDYERRSDPKVASSETLGLVFVAVVFGAGGVLLFGVNVPRSLGAFGLGLVLLVAGITRKWTIRREASRVGIRFRQAWIESPLCLGCGYDLGGLTPESDGCSVCPECGGAWRFAAGAGKT